MRCNDIEIGMRVRSTTNYSSVLVGDEGVVVTINGGSIGVRWDKYNERKHDLDGACEPGYGWYFRDEHLEEVIDEPDMEITDQELMSVLEGVYV